MKEKKLNKKEWKDLEKDMEEMSALWNMSKSDLLHKALEQRNQIKKLKEELKVQEFLMRDVVYGFGNQKPIR